MMGFRGCRLAVRYPEIAEMQTRAVIEAAIEVKQEDGYDIHPEIMIPLVGEVKELALREEDRSGYRQEGHGREGRRA